VIPPDIDSQHEEYSMNNSQRSWLLGLAAATALLSPGCSPKMPPVVPVSGTVYLDGKPLPLACIEFVPDLKDFGAESNSYAITDEEGRYSLTFGSQQISGAVTAKHRVVVTEYIPSEYRGLSAKAQQQLAEYQKKLKNRPIPDGYGVVSRTPLEVEVKKGQETYDLPLTRGR
jgi:hypothetical protein